MLGVQPRQYDKCLLDDSHDVLDLIPDWHDIKRNICSISEWIEITLQYSKELQIIHS